MSINSSESMEKDPHPYLTLCSSVSSAVLCISVSDLPTSARGAFGGKTCV